MKRKKILVFCNLLLLFTIACGDIGGSSGGSGSNNSNSASNAADKEEYDYWASLYNSWIRREIKCQGNSFYEYLSDNYTSIDTATINYVHRQVLMSLGRCNDPASYWQTTCETDIMACADCDNFATKIMMELRIYNVPDNYLGVILVRKKGEANKKQFHLMAVAFYPGSNYLSRQANFMILDNGTFESIMIRKNDFFNKYPDIELIFGFNVLEFWRF